jgi:hypothetical protein
MKLFPGKGEREQILIPFLGAGASLPDEDRTRNADRPAFPAEADVTAVLARLGFDEQDDRARMFVRFGLAIAYLMIHIDRQRGDGDLDVDSLKAKLIDEANPPSAGRLVELLQLSFGGPTTRFRRSPRTMRTTCRERISGRPSLPYFRIRNRQLQHISWSQRPPHTIWKWQASLTPTIFRLPTI